MTECLSQGPPSPPASSEQLRDPTTGGLGAHGRHGDEYV
jgi:hypothetical protein